MFDEYKKWVKSSEFLKKEKRFYFIIFGFVVTFFLIVIILLILFSGYLSIKYIISIIIVSLLITMLFINLYKWSIKSIEVSNEELRVIKDSYDNIILKVNQIFKKHNITFNIISKYRRPKFQMPTENDHITYNLTSEKYKNKNVVLTIEKFESELTKDCFIKIKPVTYENEKFIKDIKFLIENKFNISTKS